MKLHFSSSHLAATVILSASLAWQASAQPTPANNSPAPAVADASQAAPSPGVADVLKMLDAGVSKDVIKTYIETSPASFSAGAADLIALKNHGVNDEITMAILKHGSAQTTVAANATVAPAAADNASAPVRTYVINNRTDPESYDFFQRYYLMPRARANVNQTLGYPAVPYGGGFVPYYQPGYGNIYGYGSGYGVAVGFGGRRSVAFGRGVTGFPAR